MCFHESLWCFPNRFFSHLRWSEWTSTSGYQRDSRDSECHLMPMSFSKSLPHLFIDYRFRNNFCSQVNHLIGPGNQSDKLSPSLSVGRREALAVADTDNLCQPQACYATSAFSGLCCSLQQTQIRSFPGLFCCRLNQSLLTSCCLACDPTRPL